MPCKHQEEVNTNLRYFDVEIIFLNEENIICIKILNSLRRYKGQKQYGTNRNSRY